MIESSIVTAIAARLTRSLARPDAAYTAFAVAGETVGWLDPPRAARLAAFGGIFTMSAGCVNLSPSLHAEAPRTAALHQVTRALAAEGALSAWRDERYAVAPTFGAPPLFLLERAAARYFGIRTWAVHVNGLVGGGDAPRMWIARRSKAKAIDPGMLDNLVGGGIAAGQGVAATVVREAAEEAGVPAALARTARPVGVLHICRAQPDGLQRETIFAHDLWLSPGFAPAGQDGEVVEHRLADLAEAARLIALADGPDVVTADAALVVLDCLLRHGAIAADAPEYLALDALRHPDLAPRALNSVPARPPEGH